MLGNTNDGFSGFTGFDALQAQGHRRASTSAATTPARRRTTRRRASSARSARGNDRDPENGVITYHTGIRGDADAPKAWNWDVNGPVAHVTFEVVK